MQRYPAIIVCKYVHVMYDILTGRHCPVKEEPQHSKTGRHSQLNLIYLQELLRQHCMYMCVCVCVSE